MARYLRDLLEELMAAPQAGGAMLVTMGRASLSGSSLDTSHRLGRDTLGWRWRSGGGGG